MQSHITSTGKAVVGAVYTGGKTGVDIGVGIGKDILDSKDKLLKLSKSMPLTFGFHQALLTLTPFFLFLCLSFSPACLFSLPSAQQEGRRLL